jgi:type II secretory pathway pseudopilin PulG
MSRHLWRACNREAGFSFVELLVTIVIAGIAFAALVPVFVQATEKNSSDAVRLQAANVAQDKIEKIRQLPYSYLAADSANTSAGQSSPNLYDPTFADSQFGPSTPLSNGTTTRVIHTDYHVTLYPAAATGLASQYKIVTVTATWDAPPSPVKPIVLQTIVYRQYAGPPLGDFSTDPAIDDTGVLGGSDLTSVTLTAHVDLSAGASVGSVQFAVAAFGGQTIASKLVMTTDTNPALGYWYSGDGYFHWTWDCSTAANRVYDFQATAFSPDEYAGNTMHLYPQLAHTVAPAPPGAVVATGGNHTVSVSWGVSAATGLSGYEVFRSTSAAPSSFDTTTPLTTVTAPSTSCTDNTVSNNTIYYYAVRAITSGGQHSSLVVSNAVTPGVAADTTPPTAPTSLVATAAPAAATITLTWGAAIDAGGLLHYEIWRSSDGVTWGANPLTLWTNTTTLSYPDATAGWATTWYYRIRAVDLALNLGTWSNIAHATTVAAPYHDLHIAVQNGNGNDCNVWVLNASTSHFYDTTGADRGTSPPAGTAIAKNSSVVFSHLPDGAYTVYASKNATPTGAKTYGVVVQAPYGDLTKVVP